MYPRIITVRSGRKILKYLRLQKKVKENGRWKEKVVCNLARLDVEGKKAFDNLLLRLRRYSNEVLVTPEEIESKRVFEYGPVIVVKKIWNEIGIGKWINDSCKDGKTKSLGEKGVFALVLNRLMEPRSELGFVEWLEGVYLEDLNFNLIKQKTKAEKFYSTLDWLIKGKAKIEQEIYYWLRTLFPVDIVFYDITNVQFEGNGPPVARIGYHRLGKKNHKQILLGIIMIDNLPVAHHVFRGNRAEKTTLSWIVNEVKNKYNINRIIFVVDRGMITTLSLEEIEKENSGYIVSIKRRNNEEAKILLKDSNEFIKIKDNLFAKEIDTFPDTKRRIVCLNTERAKEEKEKRESIIKEIEQELSELKELVDSRKIKQVKTIVSRCEKILNKKHAGRYFTYEVKEGKFEFNRNIEKIKYEEQLDGKFIIKTTEKNLTLEEIVTKYKELMEVEKSFREIKDNLKVTPIYHYLDRRVKAHIFICVLALLIRRYIENKLKKINLNLSVDKFIEKLKNIKIVINQIKHLSLKYVTPPDNTLKKILNIFGIVNLPKILPDVSITIPAKSGTRISQEHPE